MPRKMTGRAALAALTLTASCVFAVGWSAAGPAEAAGGSSGSCQTSGGSSGGGSGSGSLYQIWLALSDKTDMCPGGGNLVGGGGGTPPHVPCWWGEVYSPTELQNAVETFGSQGSTSNWYMMLKQEYDKNGTGPMDTGYVSTQQPPWESYNIGANPPGNWWGMILNSDDTSDELKQCTAEEDARSPEIYFWAPDQTGQPSDLPTNAPTFSPQDLAVALNAMVQLPAATVQTNPTVMSPAAGTIGVPVWFWQTPDSATFPTRDICAYGVCVTFQAQATSFTIESAGPPATIDSSGCKLNSATGYLGEPYETSDGNTPSKCGVVYTDPGTGDIEVKTFWHITVTWPGGSWSPPQDGYRITQLGPVQVQEIQAYNASPTAIS